MKEAKRSAPKYTKSIQESHKGTTKRIEGYKKLRPPSIRTQPINTVNQRERPSSINILVHDQRLQRKVYFSL